MVPNPFFPNKPTPSKGLGDTAAKIFKSIGADKIAKTYEKMTGKSCGCANRQVKLNEMFPYKEK